MLLKTGSDDRRIIEEILHPLRCSKCMVIVRDPVGNPCRCSDNKAAIGVKKDNGKRQWALLPWREVGQVVDVLTWAVVSGEYGPDNWMFVEAAERRYFEAAMRHITAWRSGRINDPKTKLPHLAHAVCGLLFALWFDNQNRKGHK